MDNGSDGLGDRDPAEVSSAAEEQGEGVGPEVTRRGFLAGSVALAAVAACSPDPGTTPGDSGTTDNQPVGADSIFRIHPAIGFARLGNADPGTFFIGPEVPGYPPMGEAPGSAVPPYKVDGRIKPQAARFRVFEYKRQNGRLVPVREVTLDTPGVMAIEWTAHIANKKSSFRQFNGLQGETTRPAALRNSSVSDRRSLEIDFGPRTIQGRSAAPQDFRVGTAPDPAMEAYPRRFDGTPVIDYLGQVRTDDKGRLIVLGGQGRAAFAAENQPPMPSYVNNNGWWDDASDGPVTARVVINDGGTARPVPVDNAGGAWVMVGPPDYAPGIHATISLYDLLYDVAVREMQIPADHALYADGGPLARLRVLHDAHRTDGAEEFPGVRADFTEEVLPILETAYKTRWVTSLAVGAHESMISPMLGDPAAGMNEARQTIFGYVRGAGGAATTEAPKNMPKMLGDDPYNMGAPDTRRRLAMTRTQIGLLRQWAAGSFEAARTTPRPAPAITPHGLDRAALENGSGGAFYPGIECGWQIRNPALYVEPFRLNLAATSAFQGEEGQQIGPGHFTRQMAVPWHADFNDCRKEGENAWWPAQRPDDAFLTATAPRPVAWARPTTRYSGNRTASNHEDMVENWYKYGFVVSQGGTAYLETERAEQIP